MNENEWTKNENGNTSIECSDQKSIAHEIFSQTKGLLRIKDPQK